MSENYGLVSIIVPVYNVEKYFDECINSLLGQTYKNIEIIIVDDGTKDNCGKKADELAEKDDRVKVLHKENEGLSPARNDGLKLATGDYYCFVDSDDYVSDKYVERLVKTIAEKEADMAFCNFNAYYVNKNVPSGVLLKLEEKDISPDEYLESMYTFPGAYTEIWNKIFRKEVFKDLKFEKMVCEDAQIMLSVVDNCRKICYISDILYYYRRRKNSIANTKQEIILLNEMKWIGDHKRRLENKKRTHLSSMAQKLYISKILEKYRVCKKDKRKSIKGQLKKEIKLLMKNPEFEKKKKIKYYCASKLPYIYGLYYSRKTCDKNTFWD